jgi:acetolactate synthase-1/2/3 large subunit
MKWKWFTLGKYDRVPEGIVLPKDLSSFFAVSGYISASGEPAVLYGEGEELLPVSLSGLYYPYMEKLPLLVIVRVPKEFSPSQAFVSGVPGKLLRLSHKEEWETLHQEIAKALFSDPVLLLLSPEENEKEIYSLLFSLTLSITPPSPSSSWEEEIRSLGEALKRSSRPVFLLGGGGFHPTTREETLTSLIEIARNGKIPILLTEGAISKYPEKVDRFFQEASDLLLPPGSPLWALTLFRADLLLLLGTAGSEVDGFGLSSFTFRGKKWGVTFSSSIPSDLRPIPLPLDRFIEILKEIVPPPRRKRTFPSLSRWEKFLSFYGKRARKSFPLHPAFVVSELTSTLKEGIFVTEGGSSGMWLKAYRKGSVIFPSQTGMIGVTPPLLYGARTAFPEEEKPIIGIMGDGGVLYHPLFLQRIGEEKLPLLLILLDDNSYGAIRLAQTFFFHGKYTGTDLPPREYLPILYDLGWWGEKISQPESWAKRLPYWIQRSRKQPVFLHIPIEKDSLPFCGFHFVLAELDGTLPSLWKPFLRSFFSATLKGKVPLAPP